LYWKARNENLSRRYTCLHCGVQFGKIRYASGAYSKGTKYCSRECAFAKKAKRDLTKDIATWFHAWGGEEVVPRPKKKFAWSGGHKGRCEKFGVPYEEVSRKSIFERDDWQCQICGISLLHKYSKLGDTVDPQSPTIDHIIPLSLGADVSPGHVEDNLQAACWQCNIRWSNILDKPSIRKSLDELNPSVL
jgi:transcription elongation factor Elf1